MASAIRGSRVGAGPMGEAERGDSIARAYVSYFCANGHEVRPSFAVEETVVIPAEWDCPKCGYPAGRDATIHLARLRMSLTRLTLLTLKSVALMLKVRKF